MRSALRRPRWSPYLVGAGIGILSWMTFFFMNNALGTSTTMVRVAGALEGLVAPSHVEQNPYFAKYIVSTADTVNPVFEWQVALVLLLVVGAWLSARFAGSRRREHVPTLWAWRFGPSKMKRYIGAFLGGVILLFGARLAGGCTSGHGISGTLQLALSSWTFLIFLFASGIATAFVLYGKEGRNHV